MEENRVDPSFLVSRLFARLRCLVGHYVGLEHTIVLLERWEDSRKDEEGKRMQNG